MQSMLKLLRTAYGVTPLLAQPVPTSQEYTVSQYSKTLFSLIGLVGTTFVCEHQGRGSDSDSGLIET
jgi:hypothetical protein